MTKPANFPERKRQRQIRALARLRIPHGSKYPVLALAIAAGSQLGNRTKKDHSWRRRLER